jgi:N-acyl-D-aspartate/D-glutamate deacylase
MGLLYEYLPALGRDEVYDLMKDAAALRAPVFVHVRAATHADVDNLMTPMQEMVADAASTGASVHICHIGSKSLSAVVPVLDMLDRAKAHGVDVTTEVYPYDAGSTVIGSALFNEGWREHQGADFKDIEWPPTGERMTAESFAKFRKEQPQAFVILHTIPPATVEIAVAHPGVMIASDAVPYVGGAGHPRGTGTFARVLGVYVREKHALSLMDAIGKMTLLPAKRLEQISPAMKHKGRVQVGADADLTLFDPATVTDRATYSHPTTPSAGIPYVIVGGTPVVERGEIVKIAFPGRGVTSGR